MKKHFKLAGFVFVLIFAILTFRYFHIGELLNEGKRFFASSLFWWTCAAYGLAFLFRALAWKIYIYKPVRFSSCVQGVFISLFINHITPIKAGDILRTGILASKEKDISIDEAAHSVVVMRLIDMVVLLVFSATGLLFLGMEIKAELSGGIAAGALCLIIIAVFSMKKYMPAFFLKHLTMVKHAVRQKNSLYILPLVIGSWILESFVLWNILKSMELSFAFVNSIWVNSLTVGGQVFQVTPGGISTYESVMTAALVLTGIGGNDAYTASLLSHSFKFIFSYISGLMLILTSPAHMIGELRRNGFWGKKVQNEKRI